MKFSKEQLVERFKAIVQFEEDIKNEYDIFIEMLQNEMVLSKIKEIRDWEIRHIALADNLVDFVQKL